MKWEYKIHTFDRLRRSITSQLNGLGEEGWEVVGFNAASTWCNPSHDNEGMNGIALLKRPLEQPEQKSGD